MSETLRLPNGDEVTPEDVFLFNDYPYRYVPLDDTEFAFKLAPLYWGGSDMDVPFPERSDLVEQWGDDSRGTLTAEEWEAWLRQARSDPRFGEDELDALARELPTDDGLLASLWRRLG
jgi:hypothetical protein